METLLSHRGRPFNVIENSSPVSVSAPAESESWKHISVALAPLVSRIRRLQALDAEGRK